MQPIHPSNAKRIAQHSMPWFAPRFKQPHMVRSMRLQLILRDPCPLRRKSIGGQLLKRSEGMDMAPPWGSMTRPQLHKVRAQSGVRRCSHKHRRNQTQGSNHRRALHRPSRAGGRRARLGHGRGSCCSLLL